MTATQLRMAMAMLDLTVRELAARAGVATNTVTKMMKGRGVQYTSRTVVKLWLESEDIVFIEPVDGLSETIARRR